MIRSSANRELAILMTQSAYPGPWKTDSASDYPHCSSSLSPPPVRSLISKAWTSSSGSKPRRKSGLPVWSIFSEPEQVRQPERQLPETYFHEIGNTGDEMNKEGLVTPICNVASTRWFAYPIYRPVSCI
ncbi:unnamed protein product [Protopolystoma xenopodis]|uniref:Uncharacterized protein n=1 Tax=Protopolystoma xenopodis TaxID=117903 RepID=A0A3S5CF14_9PLAT|nr:unnamed protein product [Protopolystoma xenopodis]